MKKGCKMCLLTFFIHLSVLVLLPVNGIREEACDRYGCSQGDYESKLISSFREGCPSEMNNVQCALRKKGDIEQWLSKNNQFDILITGKMGTGKSTIVKGLTENYVPDEDEMTLLPHTLNVTSYSHQQDNVYLRMFDTPGLKDDINGINDYSYLKEMIKNSYEPDLLIFAVRMDEHFQRDDLASINNISSAFGWKVWKKAMIILTFANKVRLETEDYDTKENKKFFNRIRDELELNITSVLRHYKVQEEVVNSIPVVPVGLVTQPFIPSDERQVSWVKEFWHFVHARLQVPKEDKTPDAGLETPGQDKAATPSPTATCTPFTPEMCTPEICKCPPCKSVWDSWFN